MNPGAGASRGYPGAVPFWKRRTDADLPDDDAEPLEPRALLRLFDEIGQSCADEVGRLGGDRDQVIATVWFAENQEVSRVNLTSDGLPVNAGKKFVRELSTQAAPLRRQPSDGRLDRLDATVENGALSTQVTYRD